MRHAHQMALFDEDNAVLRAFGITILEDSNRVVIGVRTPPNILFGDNLIVTPDPAKVNTLTHPFFSFIPQSAACLGGVATNGGRNSEVPGHQRDLQLGGAV